MMSPEDFQRQLLESGLLAREAWDELRATLSADVHRDAEATARELVSRGVLTAYQAEQLLAGRGRGLQLGNYRILNKLGQGGMGTVLKAEHRRMERIVALKILSPAALQAPDAAARFQREVKAAAKLSHPNIVTAYDADEADGTHFLVMEFVDGGDMASRVRANGPLTVEQAVNCILQAARGLEYAHEQGVIHRDIKPANLLLDAKGRVKLLDLGLARFESLGAEHAELTGTGQIMGTADYMSPEQARNTRKADHRADIYSLGITLWYLLTGRAAYDGETVIERIMAHQTAPLPSLRSVRPDVTPELDAVFCRMIAKSPVDRFASMTEVLAALERCIGEDSAATRDFDPADAARLRSALRTWTGGTVLSSPGGTKTTATEATRTFVLGSPQADTDPVMRPMVSAPQSRSWKPLLLGLAAIAGVGLLILAVVQSRMKRSELTAPKASAATDLILSPDYVWTAPVNLGKQLNTSGREMCPRLTADELTLVFQRDNRLLQARRSRRDEPFGDAAPLTGGVNELDGLRMGLSLSGDGLLLAVCGKHGENLDPYLCERTSVDESFGAPVQLPPPVSSPAWELSQCLSADGLTLFVTTNRGDRNAKSIVHQFTRDSRSAAFGAEVVLGPEVNDGGMTVVDWLSSDGRILLTTQMIKTPFPTRLHVRNTTAEPFGPAQAFGPPFEKASPSAPWISPDGERLYFHSREFEGEGELDLWMSQRVRK